MKLLLQRFIAWWAFVHAIMLVTLSFNILFSSKDGVLSNEAGLLDRGLFIWRFTQLIARSRAVLAFCGTPFTVGVTKGFVGPFRHPAMAIERA